MALPNIPVFQPSNPAYTVPRIRTAAEMAQLLGIDSSHDSIRNAYLKAAADAYKANMSNWDTSRASFGQGIGQQQGQTWEQLLKLAAGQSSGATGAQAGTGAANLLSLLLGGVQNTAEGALELANTGVDLGREYASARSEAERNAMTDYNDLMTLLGQIAAEYQANEVQAWAAELAAYQPVGNSYSGSYNGGGVSVDNGGGDGGDPYAGLTLYQRQEAGQPGISGYKSVDDVLAEYAAADALREREQAVAAVAEQPTSAGVGVPADLVRQLRQEQVMYDNSYAGHDNQLVRGLLDPRIPGSPTPHYTREQQKLLDQLTPRQLHDLRENSQGAMGTSSRGAFNQAAREEQRSDRAATRKQAVDYWTNNDATSQGQTLLEAITQAGQAVNDVAAGLDTSRTRGNVGTGGSTRSSTNLRAPYSNPLMSNAAVRSQATNLLNSKKLSGNKATKAQSVAVKKPTAAAANLAAQARAQSVALMNQARQRAAQAAAQARSQAAAQAASIQQQAAAARANGGVKTSPLPSYNTGSKNVNYNPVTKSATKTYSSGSGSALNRTANAIAKQIAAAAAANKKKKNPVPTKPALR